MKKLIVLVVMLAGCHDNTQAKRVLEQQGYTSVEPTGWEPWGCARDDEVVTGFRATSPSGARVSGVVCCGLFFKGCTIRVE